MKLSHAHRTTQDGWVMVERSDRMWSTGEGNGKPLQYSCAADIGNLISGSSAFSKFSLNIRKFMVHVLLKPGLENFEHYFTSVRDECNCAVV